MLKRILTSLVSGCILVPVLILSDTVILPIGISLVTCLAVYEVMHCTGLHKNMWLSVPMYLCAFALPYIIRYVESERLTQYLMIGIFVLILYGFFVMVLSHKTAPVPSVTTALVTALYAVVGVCSIIYIHDIPAGGKYFYLLIFIGAWFTDTFAYFTGVLLGKHKLIPEISPKKTVEGSIGGIVFCTLGFVAFALIYNNFLATEGETVSYLFISIMGVVTSIVAQIGDLSMSALKRHYGIKDFGKIFPGHGGVLDRFDSVIAVAICLGIAFALR